MSSTSTQVLDTYSMMDLSPFSILVSTILVLIKCALVMRKHPLVTTYVMISLARWEKVCKYLSIYCMPPFIGRVGNDNLLIIILYLHRNLRCWWLPQWGGLPGVLPVPSPFIDHRLSCCFLTIVCVAKKFAAKNVAMQLWWLDYWVTYSNYYVKSQMCLKALHLS
jgi:hypothetical protein